MSEPVGTQVEEKNGTSELCKHNWSLKLTFISLFNLREHLGISSFINRPIKLNKMCAPLNDIPGQPTADADFCSVCSASMNGSLLVRLPDGDSSALFLCPLKAKQKLSLLSGNTINSEEVFTRFTATHTGNSICPFAKTGE